MNEKLKSYGEIDFDIDCDYDDLPEEEKDYIEHMMFGDMTDEEIGEAFDGWE